MPIRASIDIGTNSTRLLIAEQDNDHKLNPLVMIDRVTRLGTGFDENSCLSKAAMQRVIDVILEYKEQIQQHRVENPVLFATSATRDAANSREFLNAITQQSGYTPRLLSGEQEARYSYLGAISDLDETGSMLVIDIGGGSTECIYSEQGKIISATSLNIGSRRLTTKFLHSDPVTEQEYQQMVSFIQETLAAQLTYYNPDLCISVGGTAVTLAMIDKSLELTNYEKAHHHYIKIKNLQNILTQLLVKSISERKSIKGLQPDRSDVILCGAALVYELLNYFGNRTTLTSLRDLMFGVLLDS